MALGRSLLGPTSDETRKQRSTVYFEAMPDKFRGKLRLGMHDRGEEYFFANGKIHVSDLVGQARHLPLHVKVIRLEEHRIRKDEIFDVSASYTSWENLHFREELYVYVHINKLIVEPGASIEVHGNVLVFTCDQLILEHTPVDEPKAGISKTPAFEIRVLGTQHPAYSAARRLPAAHGIAGHDGRAGSDSLATVVMPTPFGPFVHVVNSDINGQDGQDGQNGTDGTNGENGGMAMLADIQFGRLENFPKASIRIFAQAGQGRTGGNGGQGGKGGAGGKSATPPNETKPWEARGGKGGDGGGGGKGGRGGNGGLSSNIFVQIPPKYLDLLVLCSCNSLGAPGGQGGRGGKWGDPGEAGTASEAAKGICGINGPDGAEGKSGRSRQGPRIHILASDDPSEAQLSNILPEVG